ncbi:MAG: hypothetical protein Kow0037_04480 [Calditrichia bacterium]
MAKNAIGILLLSFVLGWAGTPDWAPFQKFLGEWSGQESGVPGKGSGSRAYEMLFDSTYIHFRNTSQFQPQPQNPSGEIHREWGFFSFNNVGKAFYLREFHSEGYVNTYRLDSLSVDGSHFVFLTTDIENLPEGFRARLTIHFDQPNRFQEVFEIAAPGKPFKELIRNIWTKKKIGNPENSRSSINKE